MGKVKLAGMEMAGMERRVAETAGKLRVRMVLVEEMHRRHGCSRRRSSSNSRRNSGATLTVGVRSRLLVLRPVAHHSLPQQASTHMRLPVWCLRKWRQITANLKPKWQSLRPTTTTLIHGMPTYQARATCRRRSNSGTRQSSRS